MQENQQIRNTEELMALGTGRGGSHTDLTDGNVSQNIEMQALIIQGNGFRMDESEQKLNNDLYK